MSTSYAVEPPPTALATLHTTAGPITVSLFAAQTPLTTRNFLQLLLDGYYDNTLFHRVVPGFVVQAGDPTGTGDGGESIYETGRGGRGGGGEEDEEEEDLSCYNDQWAKLLRKEAGERVVFADELHSRLHFNRRGLLGMAKMGVGGGSAAPGAATYGSQFFITLGDCRAELDGQCTMFGRVEGEGIYNVMKIAEGELVDGTERPRFPVRVLRGEVLQMPKGEAWEGIKRREKVDRRLTVDVGDGRGPKGAAGDKKKVKGKSKKKVLLSFGDEEGDGEDEGAAASVRVKKAKFNTSLIKGGEEERSIGKLNGATTSKSSPPSNPIRDKQKTASDVKPVSNSHHSTTSHSPPARARASMSAGSPGSAPTPHSQSPQSPQHHRRAPSFHDSTTQLPLKNPEVPSASASSSPTPPPISAPSTSKAATLNAEIAALKASMRRDVNTTTSEPKKKKSTLEQMIPATSIRGRKRPRPGDSGGTNDSSVLKMLNAFKTRLDEAEKDAPMSGTGESHGKGKGKGKARANGNAEHGGADGDKMDVAADEEEGEEAILCDLHFIANCQSCSNWDRNDGGGGGGAGEAGDEEADDNNETDWMRHALSFEKDRLGKDLTWKRKNEEELVVIDPREREKEIRDAGRADKRKGKGVR